MWLVLGSLAVTLWAAVFVWLYQAFGDRGEA
jgi:hypothetical protein